MIKSRREQGLSSQDSRWSAGLLQTVLHQIEQLQVSPCNISVSYANTRVRCFNVPGKAIRDMAIGSFSIFPVTLDL
jgi:hypothetical protein